MPPRGSPASNGARRWAFPGRGAAGEIAGFLSRIRFGSAYHRPDGQRGPVALGVSETALVPEAPGQNRILRNPLAGAAGVRENDTPDDVSRERRVNTFPAGVNPAAQLLAATTPQTGLLADGVTPARVLPGGYEPDRIAPVRVLSDPGQSGSAHTGPERLARVE